MPTERLGGGSMRVNMYKKGDNQPDRIGRLKIDKDIPAGQYDLAGWIKTDDKGQQWMSIALNAPYVKEGSAPEPRNAPDF